jgi:hypothetical protein
VHGTHSPYGVGAGLCFGIITHELIYDRVRSNRQDRQRYFQLVKSLVYLRVTSTKYLYSLLLQSSHSPDTGLGLCFMIHLRTLV